MTSSSRTVTTAKAPSAAITAPRLPIERYRGIASIMLILMMLIAAFAPLGTSGAATSIGLPTAFDAQAGGGIDARLFDYVAEGQRQRVTVPQRQTLLRETSITSYARADIAGEVMIESGGMDPKTSTFEVPHAVRDAALAGGPERWNSMEALYSSVGDAWAINGLGAVYLLRAATVEGAEQEKLVRQAIDAFTAASTYRPDAWHYLYNWGLAEMLLGNYQQSALLLDRARQMQSQPEIGFHLGLALLRVGEPDRAIAVWQGMSGTAGTEWSRSVSEGLADALLARGDGQQAVDGYMRIFGSIDQIDWGLYEKILRLQLLRGSDGLLSTISTLVDRFPDEPRLHYDRARVLMMLGRTGAAESDLRRALELRPDEPAFHIALAELALANGRAADAQKESELALTASRLDPNAPDLELVYSRLTNPDRYQQSFAQQILAANLVRAAALSKQNNGDKARAAAEAVLAQGGSDPARAAWFRYYGGLIYAAAGESGFAQPIFRDGLASPEASGPGSGALTLAWVRSFGADKIGDLYNQLQSALGWSTDAPPPANDAATAYAYYELADKIDKSDMRINVAPLYRAAAAWEAGDRNTTGQPSLSANGLLNSVELEAAEGDYLLRTGQYDMAAVRYGQILSVEPSATGVHTNRGIAYSKGGNELLARREFELATILDPGNTLAQHDLGVMALRDGISGLPTALGAFGAARVAGGAEALWLGNDLLAAPQSVGMPLPTAAPDILSRVPALLALLLLLLHTLIFNRRGGDDSPERSRKAGVLGAPGETLASRTPAPGIAVVLAVAIVISGLAWGFADRLATGVWGIIGFALLGIVAAAVALSGHYGAQQLALRLERQRGALVTRIWPLGLLLAVIGAPFGLVYGWTLATAASGGPQTETAEAETKTATIAPVKSGSRRTVQPVAAQAGATSSEDRLPLRGWGALGPAARVATAGLLANLLLAIIFGVLYGFLGNPFWRMLTLVNVAVLAFTAVSEPQAEGWQLWRRSPLGWLLLFLLAATALTLLLLRVV